MPPRWITGTIIGFWLVTTGWVLYREVSLRYRTGEPPPFGIDLTDEVGANTISWSVREKGEPVGVGKSSVRRRGDRTFQLFSDFRFDKESVKFLSFRKVSSMTHVTPEGELLGMTAEVEVDSKLPFLGIKTIKAKVVGKVQDQYLLPQVQVESGKETYTLPLNEKVKVPGNVLNPMLLVNKYRGVSAGQSWRVPLLNPTSFKNLSIPFLDADVAEASLEWHGQIVPCFRIDYREPGKKVTARTWVRQRDGLVLQQEAEHQGREIILQRDK
jgi:hypothetical protein